MNEEVGPSHVRSEFSVADSTHASSSTAQQITAPEDPPTPHTPAKRDRSASSSPISKRQKMDNYEFGASCGLPLPTIDAGKATPVSSPAAADADPPSKERVPEMTTRAHKELERKLERERKEAERLAEKARKEQERLDEKLKREAARQLEKQKRDEEKARREAERLRKDAEREAERLRKEAEKDAERQRKEAEKAEKAAERRRKDEEKEAKRLQKEEEKEAKRQADLEAKRKKERSQPKLGNFFTISKPEAEPKTTAAVKSDYERDFLPFHLKTNATLHVRPEKFESPEDTLLWLRDQRPDVRRDNYYLTPREVVEQINLAADEHEVAGLFERLEVRYIGFAENQRPPYAGTAKLVDLELLRRLAVEPDSRLLPGTDYDYDSEIEWLQEDEDGEDLGDEDKSEDDDDDADLDEFLSSDEDLVPRAVIVGPLAPIIAWNDGNSQYALFDQYSLSSLVEGPIDPAYNYWPRPEQPKAAKASGLEAVDDAAIRALLIKIRGSQFNQTFLVELLKQEFPAVPKIAILAAVKTCAKREGDRDAKTWVINAAACEQYGIPMAS